MGPMVRCSGDFAFVDKAADRYHYAALQIRTKKERHAFRISGYHFDDFLTRVGAYFKDSTSDVPGDIKKSFIIQWDIVLVNVFWINHKGVFGRGRRKRQRMKTDGWQAFDFGWLFYSSVRHYINTYI